MTQLKKMKKKMQLKNQEIPISEGKKSIVAYLSFKFMVTLKGSLLNIN